MARIPTIVPLLVAALVVSAAGCLRKVEPETEVIEEPTPSTATLKPATDPQAGDEAVAANESQAPEAPSEPTQPQGSAWMPAPPTPSTPPTPPQNESSNATTNASEASFTPPPPSGDATANQSTTDNTTPPARRETNESVAWTTEVGSAGTCVPTFGLPDVCAPSGNPGGGGGSGVSTARIRMLGASDVARGNLTLSWADPDDTGIRLRLRLAIGVGCDAQACNSTRATNMSVAGDAPLRLSVKALDLKANETLLLFVEQVCSGGALSDCPAGRVEATVSGWLVRLAD